MQDEQCYDLNKDYLYIVTGRMNACVLIFVTLLFICKGSVQLYCRICRRAGSKVTFYNPVINIALKVYVFACAVK
jgi:hypothetical protein